MGERNGKHHTPDRNGRAGAPKGAVTDNADTSLFGDRGPVVPLNPRSQTLHASRKRPAAKPNKTDQRLLFPAFDPDGDGHAGFDAFVEWLRALEGDHQGLELSVTALPPDDTEHVKWLNCGMVWGDDVFSAHGPEGPGEAIDSSMLTLLDAGPIPDGYFLSPNAAEGMLRRADRMGRKFLPELRTALERLKARPGPAGGDA